MHALDGNRAPTKWTLFWESLPVFLAYYSIVFFVVATLMHRGFAGSVSVLRGWRFWLYPLKSLPLAASLYFVLSMIYGLVVEGSWARAFSAVGIVNIFYYWFIVLCMVMGPLIWLTYPLAILNQLVIRRFYPAPTRTT
jgi:hypothetical protein